MALGHLDELQKAEKYPIRWSLLTGFTVICEIISVIEVIIVVVRLWYRHCSDNADDNLGVLATRSSINLISTLEMLKCFNTLRPRQNGRHFPDGIFKWIFVNENARISIKISLKFDPRGPINDIPTLVQIMAWRRPGDKPLSDPMMVKLLTYICVARPQWVKRLQKLYSHYELYLGLAWPK